MSLRFNGILDKREMHGSVEVEVSIVVNMLPVTIASEFGKISLVELDSPLES